MTGPSAYQLLKQNNTEVAPVAQSAYQLLKQQDQTVIKPNESDNDSFGHKLSNFYNFIKSARADPDVVGNPEGGYLGGLKQVGSNIASDASMIANYWKNTSLSETAGDIKDIFSKENNPLSIKKLPSQIAAIPSSVLEMVQKPVEAITGAVNDNGVARPATKEEEAQNMQAAAGTAAMFISQAKLAKRFLPPTEGIKDPFGELQPLKLGKVSVSGLKQAGKVIGANVLSGGLAGGIGGAISGIGQEDQSNQIIAGALSFAPLNAAMSIFGIPDRIRKLEIKKGEYIATENNSILKLAALNSMRIDPSDPLSTLAGRVNSLTNPDDLVIQAIHNRLDQGDGYIVPGVSPELGKELHEKLNPSSSIKPPIMSRENARLAKENGTAIPKGTYVPPSDLTNLKGGPFGVEVKFEDPFDKLAYYAANEEPSEAIKSLIDDAVAQTGLSRREIISHGQFIRQQANAEVKSGRLIPRSQLEIDENNNKAQAKGLTVAKTTPVGGVVKDSNGVTWTKISEDKVSGSNGEIRPLYENNTLQILGRAGNDSYLYQPFANLASQEFNPNYGRDVSSNVRYYHSPASNSLLIAQDGSLSQVSIRKFIQSGFVPQELVSLNGKEVRVIGFSKGSVRIEDPVTSTTSSVDPKQLVRTNNSLEPKPGIISSSTGTRLAQLTPESYLDNLYKEYVTKYQASLELKSPIPYSSFYQRFFSDHKIDPNDFNNVHSYFIGKLGDDLATSSLDPEDVILRKALKEEIAEVKDSQDKNTVHELTNMAVGNGLFFSAEGGGKYRLRSMDTGKTLTIIGSPDEARDFIRNIRQQKGLDSDGGSSGSVPTSIGNIGGLAQAYNVQQPGAWENFWDRFRSLQLQKAIVPFGKILPKLDNLFTSTGPDGRLTGTDLYPKFLDIQKAEIGRANESDRNIDLRRLKTEGQRIMDMGGRLSYDQRTIAGDNLDTMSLADIESGKLIGRPPTDLERTAASDIVNSGDVGKVTDLMFKTSSANPNANIGSEAYLRTLNDIAKTYDSKVIAAATQAARIIGSNSKEVSGPLLLRLASALEDPSSALDPVTHARVNNIDPRTSTYISAVRSWFDSAGSLLGISGKDTYLPHILTSIASGDLSNIPKGLAKEIARVGITSDGSLIRDPNQLISRYHNAILNHISGYSDAVDKWETESIQELDKLKGGDYEYTIPGLKARFGDYARIIRGQQTSEDALSNATAQMNNRLGLGTPSTNSIMSLLTLSNISLRPMLAVRDFWNAMGQAYINLGREFTGKFVNRSISENIVKDLKKKNILPESGSKALVDPTSSNTDLLSQSKAGQALRSAADNSFALSGQEQMYAHINASAYVTSMELAEKYFGQLRRNEINKDQAYERLRITANYGVGLIRQIDDLLQAGKTDEAANLYAQANMRQISHVFGFHNNPIGWNGKLGRVMGQWGSYAANATDTFFDGISRGTGKDIAGKILRAGIWNGTTHVIGKAAGLNLGSWQVGNPITVFPNVGPIPGMINDMADDWERKNLPIGTTLWHLGENFIPWNKAAKGWVQGLDQVGKGHMLTGLGVGLGASLDRSK